MHVAHSNHNTRATGENMFTLNDVTLRPLEFDDIDTLYAWESNSGLDMSAGWSPKQGPAAFRHRYERRLTEPEADLYMFGIEVDKQLVGFVQLAMIDTTHRHAMLGIVLGAKELWGHGIGSTALRILMDYAFTVQGLERVYAEVYTFNTRSRRLFEGLGFQQEGLLRQHEYHNGSFQDLYVFGLLRSEFFQRYETIFKVPD
jgi:RimJ/RimL family protein N-acetyltransferase